MYNSLADGSSVGFNPIVLCDALVNWTEASELPIVYQQRKGQWLETIKAEVMLTGRMVKNEDAGISAPHD